MDVFKVPSVFCHASVSEATELWFVGHISKRLHAPPKFNSSCMPITILQSHCDSALKYSNIDMPYTYNKKLQHKVILVFSLKCYCFRKKNVKYIWRINDQYAPNEFLGCSKIYQGHKTYSWNLHLRVGPPHSLSKEYRLKSLPGWWTSNTLIALLYPAKSL